MDEKLKHIIFGKDDSQNIVNITLKNDKVFIYYETPDGKVSSEIFDYMPWVLSPTRVKEYSERLTGNQHYKYITSTTCEKYEALQEKFQREFWLPRNLNECFMLCEGSTYFKGLKVQDVSILSFDIETNGLKMNKDSKVFIISNTFRKCDKTIRKLFSIDNYSNQNEMIKAWMEWVQEVDPSIICGHNILSYDFPFLVNCYDGQLILGRDKSPVRIMNHVSKFRKDGSQTYDYNNILITGREIIDTFFLSMKYDQVERKFPSYGLKPIIKYLGLEKEGRTFIDASRIEKDWRDLKTRELIKQYAMEDADDSLKLYDLMIPASFYLTQSVPMSLQSVVNTSSGGQINSMVVRSYLQNGHSIAQTTKIEGHLAGGISFGIPGLYKNLAKIDLKSAYPSQILRFKLFDKQKDPNGNFYEIVKYFTYERFELKEQYKKTKEIYYQDREQAGKVMINSAYGALSTNYLNYNSPTLAAKITYETRELIDMSLKWATGKQKEHWIQIFKEKTGEIENES